MNTRLGSLTGAVLLAMAISTPALAEEEEPIFGHQIMTEEERQEHRETMRGLETPEERQRYREEHHQRMLERAREKGVTLPEEPGERGRGEGPRPGRGLERGRDGEHPGMPRDERGYRPDRDRKE